MMLKKYSEIDFLFRERDQADRAMECFMKSGFVRVPDYARIEVKKFMDALNSLELSYTILHKYGGKDSKYCSGYYEFMAEGFIDDRK